MIRKGLIVFIVLTLVFFFGAHNIKAEDGDEMELSMFHWNFNIDKNSDIYLSIKKKLDVEINAVTAPWSDWFNKLNIMAASGQLPDIFITYGPGDADGFEKFAREGLLLPLSSYLDDYPHINERLVGRDNQKINNDFYAVPVENPKSDHVLMIRGDWLEEQGLKNPITIKELYHVAIVFKKKYGGYPISSSPPHTSGFFWLNPIFYAFGGGWETWVKDENGKYIMCWVSEGNRKGLKFINKLYQDKLLDPEFFINTDDMKMEKFLTGKAGIVFHNSIGYYNDELRKMNKNAFIKILPPIKGEGGRGLWAMDGFFTAVSINNNISKEKKEKALELLDFLYSKNGLKLLRYGVEGKHYKEESGEITPLLPQEKGIYTTLRSIDPTAGLRDFVELGGIWVPEWNSNYQSNLEAISIGEKYGRVPLFLYSKTNAYKKYGKQLIDLTFREYISLVKSDNFDRDWEKYIEKFYEYGGKEITDEINKITANN